MEHKEPIRTKKSEMLIGKIKYIVSTHFNTASHETAEDMLLCLVADRVCAELKSPTNVVK